jgi:AraC-like ligand binding domain
MARWAENLSGCAQARQSGIAVIGRPALADYPAGAELPTRVIDDLELVWMVRGRARLRTGAGDRPLGPGDLALIPPGVPHGFAWDERRPSRHGYVHFGAAALSGPPPAAPLVVSMTDHDPLAGAAAYLLWLGGDEPSGWEGRVADTLRFVLDMMLTGPLPPTGAPDEPPPELAAAVDHLRRCGRRCRSTGSRSAISPAWGTCRGDTSAASSALRSTSPPRRRSSGSAARGPRRC